MSSNVTNEADVSPGLSLPVVVSSGILIAVMIVLTMGNNLIVLVAFAKDKTIRQFSDCLILNLAISDLLIGTICIPHYAPLLLTGSWPFGHKVCLGWLVFDYVTPAASTINICCISLDRYFLVGHPLWARTHRSSELLIAFLAIPWLLPVLFFLPAITLWEVGQGSVIPEGSCFLPYSENLSMLLTGTLIEFIFPFFTVTTVNILVYKTIRQRSKRFVRIADGPEVVSSVTCNENGGHNSSSSSFRAVKSGMRNTGTQNTSKNTAKQAFNRDRKAAKSLFILVLTFGMCWMPFEITALVSTICGGCVNPTWYEVTFWLLWINSTINPVLYPLLHSRYRRAFIKLIGRGNNQVQPLPPVTSAVNI